MYKIAVVDDSEAWCLAIAYLLHRPGYAVATFTNAHAFLEDAKHFDLALIDFSMPSRSYQKEIDGCELIHLIKKSIKTPPVLVLISAFFTKQVLPQVVEFCPEADAHLDKNMSAEELLNQVQHLLTGRKASFPHSFSRPSKFQQ
ncbi:MAG: response regulator [Oculatellaceae cyanobacterium bins.114]|nr:response regulator [Oculatellaceae cyanobacterium bins.114]